MGMYLGIEFGSTRIKATAIDDTYTPIAQGSYTWQPTYENGIWTYRLDDAVTGLKAALCGMKGLENVTAVGISGMMHGYLAFDEDWQLLTPFRTWQNTITAKAAGELSDLFAFNVPQRWSIAHLYQAIINNEEHVDRIAHITTLAGYMHHLLTGVNAVGIGEASGMFPIDSQKRCYDERMLSSFNDLIADRGFKWRIEQVLPKVLVAGEKAGNLTRMGAETVDRMLCEGIPFAPAEGDAGTGMVASNAVSERSGNISAGTSIFSMVVLEKPLKNYYREIDVVATPAGKDVAMVHCNNCTNDSNAWISILNEAAILFGAAPQTADLFEKLYQKSLEGDTDCGGVTVCNYMAGEGITHFDAGVPLVARRPDSRFTLANFLRAILYSSIATLKLGMEILEREEIHVDSLVGHGGYFKTKGVGQQYMAAACNVPIVCMETAGEGGSYGMAVLAAFLFHPHESLESFLKTEVFKNAEMTTVYPRRDIVEGFERYIVDYKKLLQVERTAVGTFHHSRLYE